MRSSPLAAGRASAARHRRWLPLLALLLALIYPFVARLYFLSLAIEVLIYAIFAISLDLLMGYTGLTSFGHAAFFGLGAYILAFVSSRSDKALHLTSNLLLTMPLVVVGAALAAAVIGFFVIRTRGIYFIAVGPLEYAFDTRASLYFLVLAMFVLVRWLLRRIVASPFGWTLRGIRENEARMSALGYHAFRYKMAAFVVAGAVAGVAGALLAYHASAASPDNLYWTTSGQVMIMVIIGGAGTLSGPLLGAATVRLLRNFASSYTERWESLVGLVFILFVIFAPRGIIGLLSGERGDKGD